MVSYPPGLKSLYGPFMELYEAVQFCAYLLVPGSGGSSDVGSWGRRAATHGEDEQAALRAGMQRHTTLHHLPCRPSGIWRQNTMSDTSRIVLGLAFIVGVYALAWWLMQIAIRPPTGFWAVDPPTDLDEDPEQPANPGPAGPTE
jgi:hypothetical protein